MGYGITSELLFASIIVFLLGGMLSARLVSVPVAIIIAALKTSVPFFYFAFFFDESTILIDSETYFEQGLTLLKGSYNPISFFFVVGAVEELQVLSGGHHILYGWLSYSSLWIFGPFHFSPIFVNVFLTFVSAFALCRLAILNGFSRSYAGGLYVFFCLHWEVVAWSSIVSVKDILILTLSIFFVYFAMLLIIKRSIFGALMCVLIAVILYWVRFYVPVLIVFSFFLYLSLSIFASGRFLTVVVLAAFGGGYVLYLGGDRVGEMLRLLSLDLSMVNGFIRMVVTPLPWSIDPLYRFLLLPAILHWLLLVPTFFGVIFLWRKKRHMRVLFIYLFVALAMYATFEELQGPRHRVQLLFVYAWAQFHFVWLCLRVVQSKTKDSGLV